MATLAEIIYAVMPEGSDKESLKPSIERSRTVSTSAYQTAAVVAAVAKSFARGFKRMCSVRAAALYNDAESVIASEVAGPPLIVEKALAAAGTPLAII